MAAVVEGADPQAEPAAGSRGADHRGEEAEQGRARPAPHHGAGTPHNLQAGAGGSGCPQQDAKPGKWLGPGGWRLTDQLLLQTGAHTHTLVYYYYLLLILGGVTVGAPLRIVHPGGTAPCPPTTPLSDTPYLTLNQLLFHKTTTLQNSKLTVWILRRVVLMFLALPNHTENKCSQKKFCKEEGAMWLEFGRVCCTNC